MEERNNVNINKEDGLVRNEKGDIRLAELWFDSEKGVVVGTYDMFKFINPSEKFLGYIQKSLDLMQEGLYMEIYDEFEEENYQKEKEFIKGEMKDLEDMRKELEGEEEIRDDNNEGEI